ncbi:MAG: homoserine dehydrogenase [Clostridia bacterium]|nr:homoserine dehydrogenase [Clostridia bacterium]
MLDVAIIGFGVVGSGAYDTVADGRTPLRVKKVLDLAVRPGFEGIMTTDYNEILSDPSIAIVAESIGGLHPAREFVLSALKAGKHVVTANKLLMANCYRELMETAAANGVCIRFTPAAGGGIPWLSTLRRTARGGQIRKIQGILNGTTNFILDKMDQKAADFDDVLAEAQALGYAEKDPSSDIDGLDVRYKIALSCNVATGLTAAPEEIPAFGIRYIRKCDFEWMKAQGLTCKLLGNYRLHEDGAVSLFVQPTLVSSHSLFASVEKNFNLVQLTGDRVGDLAFYGQGAGKDPTGFALVQDMLDLAEATPEVAYVYKEAAVDNSRTFFRYYVRTPDGAVTLTDSISVCAAQDLYKTLPEGTFVAAFAE